MPKCPTIIHTPIPLPGYSSHQFSVSVETELHDVENVANESEKLYKTLQQAVDEQMQQTGFVPPDGYGMSNGQNNGERQANGGRSNGEGTPITSKQLDLIKKVCRENNVNKDEVERMSMDMFGVGVSKTNRMQASNLIDALFDQYGKKNGHQGKYQQREPARA